MHSKLTEKNNESFSTPFTAQIKDVVANVIYEYSIFEIMHGNPSSDKFSALNSNNVT